VPDNDDPSRDGLETGLRLGCGALIGLASSLWIWIGLADGLAGRAVAVSCASAVLCAWLAWRFGDRFWRWIADWACYFWPWP
jgi:hypothetical protein